MAAHRYWRVRGLFTQNGLVTAIGLQFRTVAGGPSVVAGGTVIKSSEYNNTQFAAINAFAAGPTGNFWASSGGTIGVEWIGYDFGAGSEKDIVEIVYVSPTSDGSLRSPLRVAIEYSDNGTTWVSSFFQSLAAVVQGQSTTITKLTVTGGHRAWRMRGITNNGDYFGCAEFGMRLVSGGTNYAVRSNVLFNSCYANDNLNYWSQAACDGVPDNLYIASGNSPGVEYVGCDYGPGAAPNFVEFYVTSRSDQPNRTPNDIVIEYSDDLTTWTNYFSYTLGTFTGNQTKTFVAPAPAGTAAIQVPEARTFSVFSGPSANERVTSSRVFSIYNFPTPYVYGSAARVLLPVKRNSTMQVTESRVFAVVHGRVANPKLRAWTFTLDGHDFYVLRLGDSTTLLYDFYSEQWVQWDSTENGAWRPNVGISWEGAQGILAPGGKSYGSNVVAGDDTFGLLWFLDPYQAWDENPDYARTPQQISFERIVTGQVLGSGRVETPCYVVFVDGDNYGLTGTEFTPGITLEYSDDQGRNFVSAETLPSLDDEAANNPYAWYSLGQISSPGRIFRIVDNGVFARIDSMDMNDDGG